MINFVPGTDCIADWVKELAQARELSERYHEARMKMIRELEAKPEYQELLANENEAKENEKYCRAGIEARAEIETHPAVTKKTFTIVKILDEEKARNWCMTNFTPALSLNVKMFEKAAKDGTIPATLATVEIEYRVQIKQDLSEYLIF